MQTGKSTPTRDQVEVVMALYSKGNLDGAYAAAMSLAQKFPAYAMLQNLLGVISARKGDQETAVKYFRRTTQIDPNFPDAYNNMGVALRSLGRQDEALESYASAIKIKPDYAEAYFNLGNALRDLDRLEEAVANYTTTLRIAPNHTGARNNLGIVYEKLERYEEAIGQFSNVLLANPNLFDTYNNLGLALKKLGREREALASFAKAVEIKPDFARAHYNTGSYLFDLGRKDEALASYTQALQIDPDFAEAYRSMSAVMRYQQGDPQITQMSQMLERDGVSDADRMQLHYALGKACEDIGERDKAFEHYSAGNALRRKSLGYSPEVERSLHQNIKTAFADAGSHRALQISASGRQHQTPVFIVGMPRSGTSLTEQIIASHSKAHGAGELTSLGKAVASVWSGGVYDDDQLRAVRELYLTDMEQRGAAEPFVIDKMHLNYRWIGFICMAIPEAKIVHIKRRSIASCWSIFKYYFSDSGNGYAYDLNDLADYYSDYMDMMKFWDERFPGVIHRFGYEELTENQEDVTRKLLAHIGLDLEQSCIDFHETKRAVATISSMQVRRKLYKGSSEEWRHYEKFLGPLIDRLGTD